MNQRRLVTALALIAASALAPAAADAQGRSRSGAVRRAVPRVERRGPPLRVVRPSIVTIAPYRYYRPSYGQGFYYGYPRAYGYAPWYGPGYPSGYPYGRPAPGYIGPAPGRIYGGVRINVPQRDAEVYVDGYFAGIVNDFDGVFQHLNLEAGPHRIEIRAPGYESIAFDVRAEPGRTITYRADMRPLQP